MVRLKNRYMTIEITNKNNPDKPLLIKNLALCNAIQDKVQELFGDLGQAAIKAGFSAKYCNTHTRIAIIKVRHGPHKFIIESVPDIDIIGGISVNVKLLYTGATIRHCFLFIKRYQKQKLEKIWASLKTDKKREEMEEALMSLTPAMEDFK